MQPAREESPVVGPAASPPCRRIPEFERYVAQGAVQWYTASGSAPPPAKSEQVIPPGRQEAAPTRSSGSDPPRNYQECWIRGAQFHESERLPVPRQRQRTRNCGMRVLPSESGNSSWFQGHRLASWYWW